MKPHTNDDSSTAPSLQEILRRAIEERVVSRKLLAFAMEVSEPTVDRILGGYQLPTLAPFQSLVATAEVPAALRAELLEWFHRPIADFRSVPTARASVRELDVDQDGRVTTRDAVALEANVITSAGEALTRLLAGIRDGTLSAEQRRGVRVQLFDLEGRLALVRQCIDEEERRGGRRTA